LLDPVRFGQFYDRTMASVYGFFLHRVGGVAAVAEDLTQETYVAAVQEIRRRKPIEDPDRWIFGVARHKLLDYYRRKGRDRGVLVPWYDGVEDEASTPPLDDPLAGDLSGALDALGKLPVSQQAVMTLRYLDGLPVPEVARALGKSVHAVESLLARGRNGMKRALTEAGHE
jgi:RNA polymerase sigma-70 factor (ECF subfamily)